MAFLRKVSTTRWPQLRTVRRSTGWIGPPFMPFCTMRLKAAATSSALSQPPLCKGSFSTIVRQSSRPRRILTTLKMRCKMCCRGFHICSRPACSVQHPDRQAPDTYPEKIQVCERRASPLATCTQMHILQGGLHINCTIICHHSIQGRHMCNLPEACRAASGG